MKSARFFNWAGLVTILAAGLIHLFHAPGEYKENPYIGILFFAFFLLSVLSAIGIYRASLVSGWLQIGYGYLKTSFFWGWVLGLLLSVISIAGYLLSLTIGWPVATIEQWSPLSIYGVILVEIIFLGLYVRWHPVTLVTSRKRVHDQGRVA
jgi:hypothetical protein